MDNACTRPAKDILFTEFNSKMQKVLYVFTAILVGLGLLSAYNSMVAAKSPRIYLHWNRVLRATVRDC